MRQLKWIGTLLALLLLCAMLLGCAAQPVQLTTKQAEEAVKAYLADREESSIEIATPLFDFTPPELFKKTGFQLFKVSEGNGICQSFILKDSKVVHEIMGFGGLGLVSVAPARFERNSRALVYAYSWGSGLHHSILEVYDSERGAFSLYMNISGKDMLVEKEADNRFGIYIADFSDDFDIVDVKATKGDRLGTLSSHSIKGGGYRLVYEKTDGSKETAIVNDVSNEVLRRVEKIANPQDEAALASSSTADYIKAGRADYDAIVAMGEKALPVLLEQVVVKLDKGLNGMIVQQLIQDIVKQPAKMNAAEENIKLYKAYVGRLDAD